MNSVIEKKLAKYSVKQLQAKLGNASKEEILIINKILEKRGVLLEKTEEAPKVKPEKSLSDILKDKAKKSKAKPETETPEILGSEEPKSEVTESDEEIISVEKINKCIDDLYESGDNHALMLVSEYISEISNYDELSQDARKAIVKVHSDKFGESLPSEKKVVLPKKEKVSTPKVKKEKVESLSVEKKSGKYEIPEEASKNIGKKVSFTTASNCKEGANQKVSGFIKRVFYDKNDQAFYYYIQASGKFYCKSIKSTSIKIDE